jgi:hypothetical protein
LLDSAAVWLVDLIGIEPMTSSRRYRPNLDSLWDFGNGTLRQQII